jgi:hypothetical protein
MTATVCGLADMKRASGRGAPARAFRQEVDR